MSPIDNIPSYIKEGLSIQNAIGMVLANLALEMVDPPNDHTASSLHATLNILGDARDFTEVYVDYQEEDYIDLTFFLENGIMVDVEVPEFDQAGEHNEFALSDAIVAVLTAYGAVGLNQWISDKHITEVDFFDDDDLVRITCGNRYYTFNPETKEEKTFLTQAVN